MLPPYAKYTTPKRCAQSPRHMAFSLRSVPRGAPLPTVEPYATVRKAEDNAAPRGTEDSGTYATVRFHVERA